MTTTQHRAPATPPANDVPGSTITQAGHVAASAVADGGVLVDTRTGRRTRVDDFGRRLWEALSCQPTLPSLVASLRDDSTPTERLAEDVTHLLARWQRQGLVQWR